MFNILYRLTIFAVICSFCSCDQLFGPESRELAGGYRLKRVRGSTEVALIVPHESGGMIIDEIGWRKPVIVARGSGSRYWEVINTAHAKHTQVNDETLKSDLTYRSIQIVAAEKAWATLNRNTRIW